MPANYAPPQNVTKRVRFFDGQYLRDQDFVDDQHYHIDRQRRTNRLLRVSGICEGLTLTVENNQVKLSPGTALDSQGRLIVLSDPFAVDLNNQTGAIDIYIAYSDEASDIDASDGVTTTEAATRWWEKPRIEAVKDRSALQSNSPIWLGQVTVAENGTVTNPNMQNRNYSGIYLPSDAKPSESPVLRSGGAKRAVLSGDFQIQGSTSDKTTAGLTVTNAANNSLLYVSNDGFVGIGTAAPVARLEVNGDFRAANALVTGILTVGTPDGNINVVEALAGKATRSEVTAALGEKAPTSDVVKLAAELKGKAEKNGSATEDFTANNLTVAGNLTLRSGTSTINLAEALTSRAVPTNSAGSPEQDFQAKQLTVSGPAALKGSPNQTGLTVDSSGRVGIGTATPDSNHNFHVLAPGAVGLLQSSTSQAFLRLSTSEGFDQRVEVTNRPGGSFTVFTGGADRLYVRSNGTVGIGTPTPNGFQVVLPESSITPGAGVSISGGSTGNAKIELRNNGTGSPFIDFAQDASTDDFDARIRLADADTLAIEGASLTVSNGLSVSGSLTIGSGASAVNVGNTLTSLTTALAGKADVTALAAKADVTALNTALAAKADATALAAKADVTALNTALAAKVDVTALNTALATKADATALTTKANSAGLSTQDFQAKKLTIAESLDFGSTRRQMINLYSTDYGIGIQNGTQYFRTATNFAWYKGGTHQNDPLNAGSGGTVQMAIQDGKVSMGYSPTVPADQTATLAVNGNVGIGTPTPSATLEVNGGLKVANTILTNKIGIGIGISEPIAPLDIAQISRVGTQNAPTSHPTSVQGLYVTGNFGPDYGGVEFRHTNGYSGIGFGYNTIYATGENADQDLGLKPRGRGKVKVVGNLEVTGTLTLGSGAVDVGTTLAAKADSTALDRKANLAGLSTQDFAAKDLTAQTLRVNGNVLINGETNRFNNRKGDSILFLGDGFDYLSSGSNSFKIKFGGQSPNSSEIDAQRLGLVIGNASSNSSDSGLVLGQKDGVAVLLVTTSAGGYIGTVARHNLILRTNNTERLTIDREGRVGIGTPIPTRAMLEIAGGAEGPLLSYGFLNNVGQIGRSSSTPNIRYSLYASDRIACSEFNAHSDARLKQVKGRSNSQNDLRILSQIEITDYTLKDTISGSAGLHKKVIGQQIAQVFPQAASTVVNVVPDIFQLASISKGWIQLDNHGLKIGEKVRILVEGMAPQLCSVEATNPDQFQVSLSYEGQVFVYGREVNDFHVVDYDALAMLNISATQELYKIIDTLQTEVLQLKTQFHSSSVEKRSNQFSNGKYSSV